MKAVHTTVRHLALAHGSPPLLQLIIELASGTATRLFPHASGGAE